MTKRIFNQRWKAAVKEAMRVNSKFRKGYIATYECRTIYKPLKITKSGIYEVINTLCKIIWFEKNNSCIGLHDTIKITRAMFRGIKFIK